MVGEGKHLRFRVRQGGRDAGSAIAFGLGAQLDRVRRPVRYDLAFRLKENRWNGTVAPQLVVRRLFDAPGRLRGAARAARRALEGRRGRLDPGGAGDLRRARARRGSARGSSTSRTRSGRCWPGSSATTSYRAPPSEARNDCRGGSLRAARAESSSVWSRRASLRALRSRRRSEKDMDGIVLPCNAYSSGGDSPSETGSTLSRWRLSTSNVITRTSSTS